MQTETIPKLTSLFLPQHPKVTALSPEAQHFLEARSGSLKLLDECIIFALQNSILYTDHNDSIGLGVIGIRGILVVLHSDTRAVLMNLQYFTQIEDVIKSVGIDPSTLKTWRAYIFYTNTDNTSAYRAAQIKEYFLQHQVVTEGQGLSISSQKKVFFKGRFVEMMAYLEDGTGAIILQNDDVIAVQYCHSTYANLHILSHRLEYILSSHACPSVIYRNAWQGCLELTEPTKAILTKIFKDYPNGFKKMLQNYGYDFDQIVIQSLHDILSAYILLMKEEGITLHNFPITMPVCGLMPRRFSESFFNRDVRATPKMQMSGSDAGTSCSHA